MHQLLTLLIILAMVGALCAVVWATDPAESLKNSQMLRIQKAATLTFH
jgi:hypothetical protein